MGDNKSYIHIWVCARKHKNEIVIANGSSSIDSIPGQTRPATSILINSISFQHILNGYGLT